MKSLFSKSLVALALLSTLFVACTGSEEAIKPQASVHSSARGPIDNDPEDPNSPCQQNIGNLYDLDFPLSPAGPSFAFFVSQVDDDAIARFKIDPIGTTYDHSMDGAYGQWNYMNTAYQGEWTPSHQYTRMHGAWTSSLMYLDYLHASETWEYVLTIQNWRTQSNCPSKEFKYKLHVHYNAATNQLIKWIAPM